MPQCDTCMAGVDVDEDTHLTVVKPMELKGRTEKVTAYYCSADCLLERVDR